MTFFQEAIFKLNNPQGKKLGVLKIRAENKSAEEFPDIKTEHLSCQNIPTVEQPTNKHLIEYCNVNPSSNINRMMFLEETEYDISFKAEKKEWEIQSFLPEIGSLFFKQNLFNESKNSRVGTLNFKSYVGKTWISITVNGQSSIRIPIEIRSKKIGYSDEYIKMMSDLSEECSSLIFDMSSSVHQLFEFGETERITYYEDYLFLEYIFNENNLPSAYNLIRKQPKTKLEEVKELLPVGNVSFLNQDDLINLASNKDMVRFKEKIDVLPDNMDCIPCEVCQTNYQETVDIPENRFIKFYLEQIYSFIIKLKKSDVNIGYINDRLDYFKGEIIDFLSDEWLKALNSISYIPLNSQILQKKAGYREIYYQYLNFEIAFKFIWTELEESIKGNEKKLSTLYEFWCFFKLIKALKKISKIKIQNSDLINKDASGWKVNLKRGKRSKLSFNYEDKQGVLHVIEIYYNRRFSKNGKRYERTYSLPFRPDYTIVIKAEDDNRPQYIHFDAKYRSDIELEEAGFFKVNKEPSDDLEEKRNDEEKSQRVFKAGDIYKMHTYKDAIISSIGSYILYPGTKRRVFKEDFEDEDILPSVGAIPLIPQNIESEMQIEKLSVFLKEMIEEKLEKRLATAN